jgi:hypothetical protein
MRFSCTPKTVTDLKEVISASYPTFRRRGETHEEFVEDVAKLPFGDDPRVKEHLDWWRDNCVASTKNGAKRWARMSDNVSTSYDQKIGRE